MPEFTIGLTRPGPRSRRRSSRRVGVHHQVTGASSHLAPIESRPDMSTRRELAAQNVALGDVVGLRGGPHLQDAGQLRPGSPHPDQVDAAPRPGPYFGPRHRAAGSGASLTASAHPSLSPLWPSGFGGAFLDFRLGQQFNVFVICLYANDFSGPIGKSKDDTVLLETFVVAWLVKNPFDWISNRVHNLVKITVV